MKQLLCPSLLYWHVCRLWQESDQQAATSNLRDMSWNNIQVVPFSGRTFLPEIYTEDVSAGGDDKVKELSAFRKLVFLH